MRTKKADEKKIPDEPVGVREVQSEMEPVVTETGVREFHLLEYNLFWILQLLIIACTIYFLGGNLETCLEFFLKVIDPMNWFST